MGLFSGPGLNFGTAIGLLNPLTTVTTAYEIGKQAADPNIDLIPGIGPNEAARRAAQQQGSAGASAQNRSDASNAVANAYGAYAGSGGTAGRASSGGASGTSYASPSDLAFLDDQSNQLRDLLGRTQVGLDQGVARNNEEYQRNLDSSNADKTKAYNGYADQRIAQDTQKQDTFSTINKNANNGYRSLAQIIGRAAGTGSSAFSELLPDVIGKNISSGRKEAIDTNAENMQQIDKSQKQYDLDFAGVLEDLLRQRNNNENSLRTGVENQRQSLNSQLATTASQRAQALGGGYAQVKAAQAPYQQAINSSRDAVQNFFNQFSTPYTAKAAVASAPSLSDYNVDRADVNAQNSGGALDPSNPYASLLRRRLTEGATV